VLSNSLAEKDWDEVIDVNLKGAFLCTREVIKHMVKKGNNIQGKVNNYSIINISSVQEQTPQPESAPYSASKGGMEMVTKTVALEAADKATRVNGIALVFRRCSHFVRNLASFFSFLEKFRR
jgi:glucose 1-dehydrogenase